MADAARQRRAELGWRQDDVVANVPPDRAISIETVRRIEAGDQGSYRPNTLAAYSLAVNWPATRLWDIAHGRKASTDALTRLEERVGALEETVDSILAALESDERSE